MRWLNAWLAHLFFSNRSTVHINTDVFHLPALMPLGASPLSARSRELDVLVNAFSPRIILAEPHLDVNRMNAVRARRSYVGGAADGLRFRDGNRHVHCQKFKRGPRRRYAALARVKCYSGSVVCITTLINSPSSKERSISRCCGGVICSSRVNSRSRN